MSGQNPLYGKPGASGNEMGLLFVALIVVLGLLYWTGAFNNIHPSMPTIGQQSGTNMTESQMIASQFGSYAPQAMKIANCESGMNPNAVNTQAVGGSYATGLFQILYPSTWNTTSFASGNPKDAWTNTQAAAQIFHRDGNNWHEWACAKIVGLE